MIEEIENAEPSLSNIRNLSALYTVRNTLKASSADKVEIELNDIFPYYREYVNVKRKYQLHEVSEEAVIIHMKELCTEIKEFIRMLYSCTDTPIERELIQQMLKEVL